MTTQKQISRTLIGLAIGFGFMWAGTALAEEPVPPGPGVTIDVTGVAEPTSPDPVANCTGTDPVICPTLREAIMFANGNTATDGTQTQDTIMLPAGTYVLTIEGADETFEPGGSPDEVPDVTNLPDASVGDLDLTESVIIQGAGSAGTFIQWAEDAEVKDRIFHIYDPTEDIIAEIRGLSVSNGELLAELLGEGPPSDLPGGLPTEWRGMRAGAGIAMGPAATAVLNDPNKVGGADNADGGEGGSQKPDDPGDETGGSYALTLSDVHISDNATDGDGGGLYNAGPVTANEIVVTSNTSGKNGGGIYNEGESLIQRSTIADNVAEGGGGMFVTGNPATSLSVNSSTFSGNTAVGGGAISGRVVEINLTNCTISGNTGSDVGGGVYSNGEVNLVNCTVVDNDAGGDQPGGGAGINVFNSGNVSVTLVNTLLSGNLGGAENPRDANCGCTGSQANCVDGMNRKIETKGYNLSDDATCNLDGEGDQDNVGDAL
ncbi:MAG: right-handed parallel beta-helix repeat-containing protein, partial [Deltaproteobacteria bacterium]